MLGELNESRRWASCQVGIKVAQGISSIGLRWISKIFDTFRLHFSRSARFMGRESSGRLLGIDKLL